MAEPSYFGHVNLDGVGPNQLFQAAGYPPADWYDLSSTGNNIESIAAGRQTAADVWNAWKESSGHRAHLLSEHDFCRAQASVGFGYYHDPASPYSDDWGIITAPPMDV